MVRTAIITGDGPCPGTQPLMATINVEIIDEGPSAGCARIEVINSSMSTGFIGSLCLLVDNQGPFTQISGPGSEGPLNGGPCVPGECFQNADIVQQFPAGNQRINPGQMGIFIICSAQPLTVEDFESVALHFQGIQGCPGNNNSICLSADFMDMTTTTTTSTSTTTSSTTSTTTSSTTSTTTSSTTSTTTSSTTSTTTTTDTTTVCPIPNPQTCCQHVVEFNTQIVPPALGGIENIETDVFIAEKPVVEDVCPEKVIICGRLIKVIRYTAILETGIRVENNILTDERDFQCIIDREDANEGDQYDVVGYDVLCEGTPRLQNRGSRPEELPATGSVDVYWKLIEKDIVKVCIRKSI